MAAEDKLATLIDRNSVLFSAYEQWSNAQTKLLSGTLYDPDSFDAEGGKTGGLGYYPVVNVSGQTIYIPCLARLQAIAAGSADPEAVETLLSAQVNAAVAPANDFIEAARGGAYRRARRFLYSFTDRLGEKVLWAIDRRTLHTITTGVRTRVIPRKYRRPGQYVDSISASGKPLIGFLRDGTVSLKMSDFALRLQDRDQQSRAKWRGRESVTDLRVGEFTNHGLVRDADGSTWRAGQARRSVGLTTAVSLPPAGWIAQGIAGLGQSNSAGGSANANSSPLNVTPFTHHVMCLARYDGWTFMEMSGGSTTADFSQLLDLLPARHRQDYGLSPILCGADALEALNRRYRTMSPGYCVGTSWRGSTAIEDFMPGEGFNLYEHLIESQRAMKAAYGRYGIGYECAAIFFVQGEQASVTGTYADNLEALIDTVGPGVQAALGQAAQPHWFMLQTNQAGGDSVDNGNCLAQLAVARERLGAGVTLIGPMLQGEFFDQQVGGTGTGNTHQNSKGRMLMGELFALAKRVVDQGGIFRPLGFDRTVTRTGAQIDIVYSNMPGPQLLIDTDVVPAVPNFGFVARKLADDTTLSIASVAIIGANTIRVMLAADPTESFYVDHAINSGAPLRTWADGRTQIYVSSGEATLFPGQGLPAIIRHYAVRDRFSFTI